MVEEYGHWLEPGPHTPPPAQPGPSRSIRLATGQATPVPYEDTSDNEQQDVHHSIQNIMAAMSEAEEALPSNFIGRFEPSRKAPEPPARVSTTHATADIIQLNRGRSSSTASATTIPTSSSEDVVMPSFTKTQEADLRRHFAEVIHTAKNNLRDAGYSEDEVSTLAAEGKKRTLRLRLLVVPQPDSKNPRLIWWKGEETEEEARLRGLAIDEQTRDALSRRRAAIDEIWNDETVPLYRKIDVLSPEYDTIAATLKNLNKRIVSAGGIQLL